MNVTDVFFGIGYQKLIFFAIEILCKAWNWLHLKIKVMKRISKFSYGDPGIFFGTVTLLYQMFNQLFFQILSGHRFHYVMRAHIHILLNLLPKKLTQCSLMQRSTSNWTTFISVKQKANHGCYFNLPKLLIPEEKWCRPGPVRLIMRLQSSIKRKSCPDCYFHKAIQFLAASPNTPLSLSPMAYL